MVTKRELARWAEVDINTCDPGELTELQDLIIDPALPAAERMSRFLEQVGNPYLFKVGGVVVKVRYGGEKRLSALLSSLMTDQ